jgi:hypothetical protein
MGNPCLVATSVCTCSFGVTPAPLIALPLPGKPAINGMPVALITDVLVANLPTFGMCTTQTNPAVALATSAALGTPTPAPCLPVLLPTGWAPGSITANFNGVPFATSASKANCAYGGVVSVTVCPNTIVTV